MNITILPSKTPNDYTFKEEPARTSLVVQWLRLHASSAGDIGSVSGQGTRMTPAAQPKKKEEIF